jgi:hypothetical protein
VGSNPALFGEKVAHRREHHRLKKGMTRGDQRKRIFFTKINAGTINHYTFSGRLTAAQKILAFWSRSGREHRL